MRLPTYFISHGGGPWPWVADWRAQFINLEASLVAMAADFEIEPRAIMVISGHWEEPNFAVMSASHPPMVYDYYGFPKETYEVRYPAPGAVALAHKTAELIQAAGHKVTLDDARGFDHGAFVPLFIMYPDAQVPTFQLSLKSGYDPATHLAIGRALAPLRDEGVLIIGSGLSYHNLRLFGPAARAPSEEFDAWLFSTLHQPPAARSLKIIDWETAPAARICHPQEDHLAPLFIALGAAEDAPCQRIYHDKDIFGGVTASSYRFGSLQQSQKLKR